MDDAIVELVHDEIRRASDTGETVSRSELQATLGLGAGDLGQALDVLRERGEVTESVPDGFEVFLEVVDPRDDAPAVRVGRQTPMRPMAEQVESRVSLTFGVAAALDEQALGSLVKAGIAEAQEAGADFVFEVTR